MIDVSQEPFPVIKYRDYDNSVKELDPQKVLAFSSQNIPYETQATTYFVVAQLTERANFNWNNSKALVNQLRGELYKRYVADLTGTKRPTENTISAHIESDPTYIKAINKCNECEFKYRTLLRLTNAFDQRKDLMQSLSASERAKWNSGQNTTLVNSNGELVDPTSTTDTTTTSHALSDFLRQQKNTN